MLAQVALGVPATQVSVERAFSALKFVLSEQRSRLSASTLDDLLLLKSCAPLTKIRDSNLRKNKYQVFVVSLLRNFLRLPS